jgi:hypothetical protein
MNTKVPVWSEDGWEAVYDAACEQYPYEANNEPPKDISMNENVRQQEETFFVPYTGDTIKKELLHPCVVESTFECNIRCKLHPKNGVIEIGPGVDPNYKEGYIRVYVKYNYTVPAACAKQEVVENYDFPPVRSKEPRVVDMRTFSGIVINQQFFGGDCRNYYQDGKLHRDDGPAIESFDGKVNVWYVDGKRHRDDGPAFIGNQRKAWYKHGKMHREDGPAYMYLFPAALDGHLDKYYLEGKELTKEEWERKTSLVRALATITKFAKDLKNNPPKSITKIINENAGATIKTGIPYLDAATCKGIPKGKITEMHGEAPGLKKLRNITDLFTLDQIEKEGGSRCKQCNEFNEYVVDPYYVCYSCKNG